MSRVVSSALSRACSSSSQPRFSREGAPEDKLNRQPRVLPWDAERPGHAATVGRGHEAVKGVRRAHVSLDRLSGPTYSRATSSTASEGGRQPCFWLASSLVSVVSGAVCVPSALSSYWLSWCLSHTRARPIRSGLQVSTTAVTSMRLWSLWSARPELSRPRPCSRGQPRSWLGRSP